MRRNAFLALSVSVSLSLLGALSLGAQAASPLLPAGNPRYACLEDLSLSSGILPLLSEAPLPAARLEAAAREAMLRRAPDAALSARTAALRAILGSENRLHINAGGSPIALGARLSLHPDLEFALPDSTIPSLSGYGKRPPFFSADMEALIGKALSLGMRLTAESNPDALDQDLAPQGILNLPWDFAGFDFRQPARSYSFLSAAYGSFLIGRQEVDWGPEAGHNLFLSSSAGSLDLASAALSFPDLDYRFLAASLDAREEGFLGSSDGTPYDDVPRTLIAHRLSLRLWKRLRLALNEATMVGGVIPDLSQFNPLSIFHDSFDYKHASVMLSAEAECLPWKYLSLHGSFAACQLQSSWEKASYPAAAAMPDSYAWQAGAKFAYPAGPGFSVARSSFSYVNPWMYLREYPAISYTNEHYLGSNVPGGDQYDLPSLGHPLGPDALELRVEGGWRSPGKLSVLGLFRWTAKGEQELDSPYAIGEAAVSLVAPSGIPEYQSVLGIEFAWTLLEGLDLEAALAGVWRRNAGHAAGTSDAECQARIGLRAEGLSLGRALGSPRGP